jgi:hypothetical protein
LKCPTCPQLLCQSLYLSRFLWQKWNVL